MALIADMSGKWQYYSGSIIGRFLYYRAWAVREGRKGIFFLRASCAWNIFVSLWKEWKYCVWPLFFLFSSFFSFFSLFSLFSPFFLPPFFLPPPLFPPFLSVVTGAVSFPCYRTWNSMFRFYVDEKIPTPKQETLLLIDDCPLLSDVADAGCAWGVPHPARPHLRTSRRKHGRREATTADGQVRSCPQLFHWCQFSFSFFSFDRMAGDMKVPPPPTHISPPFLPAFSIARKKNETYA